MPCTAHARTATLNSLWEPGTAVSGECSAAEEWRVRTIEGLGRAEVVRVAGQQDWRQGLWRAATATEVGSGP